ncbi:MAG: hypothetical protein HS126_27030 [Anaerolineales bacterium]|nr:hypothetical protein [Anaerolineales bacterium]
MNRPQTAPEQLEANSVVVPQMTRLALRRDKLIAALAVLVFAVVMFRSAWLSDDAYITFRTVDNWVNGYGLTWNVMERVQAYTHPLWMFLVAAVYAFTGEIFYTSLFLSMLVSLAVILVFAFKIIDSPGAAALGVTILACSKAFVDYATSGLENPLTYLLLALFLWLYLSHRQPGFNLQALFWLALIAALATLNRMDALLFFLPPLGYTSLFLTPQRTGNLTPSRLTLYVLRLMVIIAGFIPFILWEFFSLFYYGFLFPNTAYAKLNTGIGQATLLNVGFYYLSNSLRSDPLTLLVIVMGLLTAFTARESRKITLALGVILYLIYIVKIGGDFMSGRFLAAPLFVAATLLVLNIQHSTFNVQQTRLPVWGLMLGVVLLLGLLSPRSPLLSDATYGQNREGIRDHYGIEDERAYYYQASGLLRALQNPGLTWPNHDWVVKGQAARQAGPAVEIRGAIGYFGFFAGPQVYVVDKMALADPLLARLPAELSPDWRIGHFTRHIPPGYIETLQSGQNQLTPPELAAYYDKLAWVVRGPLFDRDRLVEIWKLNTGQYNAWLATYRPFFQVDRPSPAKRLWSEANHLTDYAGIELNLGTLHYVQEAQIRLTSEGTEIPAEQGHFQLVYYHGDSPVADQTLQLPAQIPAAGVTSPIKIPEAAALQGYDRIRILPVESELLYPSIYVIGEISFPQ